MVHPIYCEYRFSTVRFQTNSETRVVGNSDEAGCLNANSPSSIASSPTPISTSSSKTLSNATLAPTAVNDNSHGPTGVVIGGVIVGSIVALVAISTLGMFLYSRRGSKKDPPSAYFSRYFSSGKRDGGRVHSVDLTATQPNDLHSSPMYPPQEYYATPFVSPPYSGYGPERQDEYNIVPYSPFSGVSGGRNFSAAPSSYSGDESAIYQNSSSHCQGNTRRGSAQYSIGRGTSISSKAAMAGVSASGYGPTPRFVLHTDAGVMDGVEEVVELPPTYNDVSGGTAPNTPTAATQGQPPTSNSHSYSGGASVVDAQVHPLAPPPVLSDRSNPPTPPVLPQVNHQLDGLDSYDLGNGLALESRLGSPPQSPRGTQHTQPQHGYPFSSPSAQSGSN